MCSCFVLGAFVMLSCPKYRNRWRHTVKTVQDEECTGGSLHIPSTIKQISFGSFLHAFSVVT